MSRNRRSPAQRQRRILRDTDWFIRKHVSPQQELSFLAGDFSGKGFAPSEENPNDVIIVFPDEERQTEQGRDVPEDFIEEDGTRHPIH